MKKPCRTSQPSSRSSRSADPDSTPSATTLRSSALARLRTVRTIASSPGLLWAVAAEAELGEAEKGVHVVEAKASRAIIGSWCLPTRRPRARRRRPEGLGRRRTFWCGRSPGCASDGPGSVVTGLSLPALRAAPTVRGTPSLSVDLQSDPTTYKPDGVFVSGAHEPRNYVSRAPHVVTTTCDHATSRIDKVAPPALRVTTNDRPALAPASDAR